MIEGDDAPHVLCVAALADTYDDPALTGIQHSIDPAFMPGRVRFALFDLARRDG